jgi:GNAT superfamily N-acetyltransferase
VIEQVKVRIGRPEDLDGVMSLALQCTYENGLVRPDVEKILREMWASLHQDHGVVGVVGDLGHPPEAGILLRVDTLSYSDEPILCERAVFVHPDFRQAKGGRASRLCEFAKQCAASLNMTLLIGMLSSDRTDAKVRLYERHFGHPAGAYWLWGQKTGVKQEAAE